MTQYWTMGSSIPGEIGAAAVLAEQDGWDGVVYVDSQNLRPDCFTTMAFALAATTRLRVSPGVTNPLTRHPAVAASAIAALHAESGGRCSYGIGRGDSALAYIGLAPCSVPFFERYVRNVRQFLRAGRVDFAELGVDAELASLETLHLHDQPAESWLRWLGGVETTVPVEVVATGPKVIAVGGRHADIVTFTVGADPDRIRWGMATARDAAEKAGRDPSTLRFGAYVNIACHDDIDMARTLVSGGLASFSRFAAMHGKAVGPDSALTGVLEQISASYDMKHHGEPDSSQTDVMTAEFVDRFGIVGDSAACRRRLVELAELGLERLYVFTQNQGTREAYPTESARSRELTVQELLPSLPR